MTKNLKKLTNIHGYIVVSDSLWPHRLWPTGCSVHGILQARILEWVAISFSKGSSQPRDRIWVSCITGRLFTVWVTRGLIIWEDQCSRNRTKQYSYEIGEEMTCLLFSCSVMSDCYLPGSSVPGIFQAKILKCCHFLLHITWLDNYNSLNCDWEQNKSHRIKV